MGLFELFIGFRYLKAKKTQGIISFNTILSITIVTIGVFILVVVMSVMSGFQSSIKDKILDVWSHISITHYSINGNKGISNYIELKKKIESVKGVKSAEPYIEGQALFRFGENLNPVVVRGSGIGNVPPPEDAKFIVEGNKSYSAGDEVYIGIEMALNNDIQIGDRIELFVPKGKLSATTGIQAGKETFRVIGFFQTHYYEYDTSLIFMSLRSAQLLYDFGNTASGIGVKVDDIYKTEQTENRIQAATGFIYQSRTAEEKNQNFFYALRLEKLIMIIILFLVIISALFTIMGTVVMVVSEKKRAIGILKSMGAKPGSIMTIFVMEGFVIGLIGSLIGAVLGLVTSANLQAIIDWVERSINSIMLFVYKVFGLGIFEPISLVPKNVYYIDSIPTVIVPEFVVTIAILTVFLSTVAAIFPAWHASRLQPIETIRYE